MQAGERKKPCDSSHFRRESMTFWPKGHPVMFPHLRTDHWTKMKTMVPNYCASLPAAMLKDRELNRTTTSSSRLPPLTLDEAAVNDPAASTKQAYSFRQNRPQTAPRSMPQFRNEFNDRARMGFCYWAVEKKPPACRGRTLGTYKTFLGLPKL